MDIDRLQSVGLVIIRPKSTQSDRKSDLLKIFRPESVKILKKRSPTFWRPFLVSYLFRIQNQLLGFHLFSSYRKLYLSWLIAGSQYHESGTLEEIALDGLLQLGLSNMKLIRCNVSIIHRHDIRIALHGEGQLIECLSILHVQYPSALLIYYIDANVHQILTVSMPGLHIRNQLQSHSPPTSPSGRYDRTHRSHKQQLKFHSPFTITRAYS